MSSSAYSSNAYKRVTIETASQGKLIVMLFNGAIKHAEEGKRFMAMRDNTRTHINLIKAQEICSQNPCTASSCNSVATPSSM